jgi:hypothetical protein
MGAQQVSKIQAMPLVQCLQIPSGNSRKLSEHVCALETWLHALIVFVMKSRMNREVHVRFCERFRGEIPLYLLDFFNPSFNQFIFAARFPCQALEREGLKGSCHKFGFGRAQSVYGMCLSAKGWCELNFY